MNDTTTPKTERNTRTRKGKTPPELDLPASDIREIDSPPPPASESAAETMPSAPVEPGIDEVRPEETRPEETRPEEVRPEETPVEAQAEPVAPQPAAPAPAPSRLVPALIGLVAGLVGGVGGTLLAGKLPAAPPALSPALTERLAKAEDGMALLRGEVSALTTRLAAEREAARATLQALEARAASAPQPGPDIEALRSRLGKLEGESQVVPKEVGVLGNRVGTLQPKLESLEKTVETLNSRVASVGAKDALATANGRQAAQTLLEEAFASGKPYAEPLDLVTRTGGDASLIALVKPFAEGGAPSAKALREEFAALKPKPAPAPASEGGFMDRARKAALSLVEVRQVGSTTAKGDEATLARVDQALARGDLAPALAESAGLSPSLAPTFAPWRARLEARIRAGEAVTQLRKDAQAALARAAAAAK